MLTLDHVKILFINDFAKSWHLYIDLLFISGILSIVFFFFTLSCINPWDNKVCGDKSWQITLIFFPQRNLFLFTFIFLLIWIKSFFFFFFDMMETSSFLKVQTQVTCTYHNCQFNLCCGYQCYCWSVWENF